MQDKTLIKYYNDIPKGRENAVTKQDLSARWGTSERQTRKIISEMARIDFGDGQVIISSSHSKGFWKTADPSEIAAAYKEITNRGRNTFLRGELLKQRLREHDAENQLLIN